MRETNEERNGKDEETKEIRNKVINNNRLQTKNNNIRKR